MPTRKLPPRLRTLAAIINADDRGYTAKIVEGYCDTDRHPSGVRWRIPGKGRIGNRLVVTSDSGEVVLDHNAAETYRHNWEVVAWMVRNGFGLPARESVD